MNGLADPVPAPRLETLGEYASKEVLRAAGLPVVRTLLAASREEAMAAGSVIGFPVVLKISSPDIVHKSDVGGVRLDVRSAAEAGAAYDEMLAVVRRAAADADIRGVTVQQMAPPGVELIIGMHRDPQFGPVLLTGLGGVLVELLGDTSLRVVPVERPDAAEMLRELRGFPLLAGFRGSEAVDLRALEDLIVGVSRLVERSADVEQLDLNPVVVLRTGVLVLDARIVRGGQRRGWTGDAGDGDAVDATAPAAGRIP